MALLRSAFSTFGPLGVTLVCGSAMFITSLDSTVVNVALPTLRSELSASPAQLQWIIDAYTLTLAVLLLLAGALGDRLGRRTLFRVGLVVFGLASLGCALATGPGQLIAVRVLQACGAALLAPNSLSTVTTAITDPVKRARAIGVWAGIFGLAAAVGPLVGGVLIDTLGWRWIFLINLPIVALALIGSLRIPETRSGTPRPLDPAGIALAGLAIFGITEFLISGAHHGYGGPASILCAALAIGGVAGFLVVERRRADPVFPLALVKRRTFTAATATAVLAFAILAGFLFISSVYWQRDRGFSALETGLALLPATLAIALVSPLSGRLIHVVGARTLLIASGLLLTVGAVIVAAATGSDGYLPYAVGYLALGLGFGLVNPPITNIAVAGLPPHQSGVASALATTSRQLGNTLGVAVLAAFVTAAQADSTASLRQAWIVIIGLALAITAINTFAVNRPAREPIPIPVKA
ncbi:MFS transporter [Nocardia sp. NPDC051030]|uniref:MFS transporter n=1 Tax=Nocardia sp. NPDC051030 TaxID=3155162 RepID=UPI0034438D18